MANQWSAGGGSRQDLGGSWKASESIPRDQRDHRQGSTNEFRSSSHRGMRENWELRGNLGGTTRESSKNTGRTTSAEFTREPNSTATPQGNQERLEGCDSTRLGPVRRPDWPNTETLNARTLENGRCYALQVILSRRFMAGKSAPCAFASKNIGLLRCRNSEIGTLPLPAMAGRGQWGLGAWQDGRITCVDGR